MKNYCDRLGFLTTLTVILLAAQSTLAAELNIKEIELEKENNQLEIKLASSKKKTPFIKTPKGK